MGYDPSFIPGRHIPLPHMNRKVRASAFQDGEYVHHSRYSILFNQDRGFAACTAHNVDGASLSDKQFTHRSFKFDPLIKPNFLQVDRDRGYRNNPWDQGHLTRRKSLSWGDPAAAAIAEKESDHWSNIAPQHETLHDNAWGKVEDWMLAHVQGPGKRACVFNGPVFTDDDPEHKNGPDELPIRIPAGFWKIISIEVNGAMRSAGFLIWQRDYDAAVPLPFAPELEQVRRTTIEVLTGLSFPDLRLFDPLVYGPIDAAAEQMFGLELARSADTAFPPLAPSPFPRPPLPRPAPLSLASGHHSALLKPSNPRAIKGSDSLVL